MMAASDFVCDAPRCPMSGKDAACDRWRENCIQGNFRKVVSQFAGFGEWDIHEWSVGSGKYYAKLFGRFGFVTIEDYRWKGKGFTVSGRS